MASPVPSHLSLSVQGTAPTGMSRDGSPDADGALSISPHGTPESDSLDTVEKLKNELLGASEVLPGYQEYFSELADNVEGLRDLWIDSTGGARMVWADDDVKLLLSSVLKIENNKNEELLALKGKKVVKVPYKVSEGGMPKPCLNFIAWTLRTKGSSAARVATADAVKRKWGTLVDRHNTIKHFENFSGGPFPFDSVDGFGRLSRGLAGEMDDMIKGTYKGPKARLLSEIKVIKPYRHTGWAHWLHMKAVDEARGGLGKATGNFAQKWVRHESARQRIRELYDLRGDAAGVTYDLRVDDVMLG